MTSVTDYHPVAFTCDIVDCRFHNIQINLRFATANEFPKSGDPLVKTIIGASGHLSFFNNGLKPFIIEQLPKTGVLYK